MSAHSGYKVRILMLTSAVGMALSGTAYAEDLMPGMIENPFAELMPLDNEQLMKARGGYSVGGFKFNIGVTVTPPVVTPVNPLPKGGPLGPNGALGPDGALGPGGALGPKGVLGSDEVPETEGTPDPAGVSGPVELSPSANLPESNTATTPATVDAQPAPNAAQPAGDSTAGPPSSGAVPHAPQTTPNPSQSVGPVAPANQTAPSDDSGAPSSPPVIPPPPTAPEPAPPSPARTQKAGATNGALTTTNTQTSPPSAEPGAPAHSSGSSSEFAPAGSNSVNGAVEHKDSVPARSVLYLAGSPLEDTPLEQENGRTGEFLDNSSRSNSALLEKSSPTPKIPTPSASASEAIVTQDGLSIRIDNALDNVVIQTTTNYDIAFEGYHQSIGSSIALGAVQSAIATTRILGGLNN